MRGRPAARLTECAARQVGLLREDRADPLEVAREETTEWLNRCLHSHAAALGYTHLKMEGRPQTSIAGCGKSGGGLLVVCSVVSRLEGQVEAYEVRRLC